MNIYNITFSALEEYFFKRGENKAKAKIVYNAVYKKKTTDFDKIEELSDRVKAMLKADFEFSGVKTLKETGGFSLRRLAVEISDKKSLPDTVKLLFKLDDNHAVEAVIMKHDYGNALCVSTQVGCNMGCAFCQSGMNQKVRDLQPFEMVLQLLLAEAEIGEKITRLTLMGIGEPLDNFKNVMNFISIAGHRHGLALAPRHITISTCGLIPEMKRLMSEEIYQGFNLAISLHAPNDEIRSRLMPVNKAYGIEQLIQTVREYSNVKNKKTTLEYVMLDGINDSDQNARELAELLKDVNCYVNLIPYNKTNLGFKRSDKDRIKRFYEILIESGIRAVVRREFGGEINAACGQLRANCAEKMD